GALAEPLKRGLVDDAATRNDDIVLTEILKADRRDRHALTRIFRDRETELEIGTVSSHVLANPDFGFRTQSVTEIDAAALAQLKILRDAVALVVDIELGSG